MFEIRHSTYDGKTSIDSQISFASLVMKMDAKNTEDPFNMNLLAVYFT